MKLKKIVLDNFRCFEHLEMTFGERLTVIVGGNGTGKTAVLDAVALLFGPFLTRLPEVSGILPNLSDIRVNSSGKIEYFVRCYAEASVFSDWLSFKKRPKWSVERFNPSWSVGKLRDRSSSTRHQTSKILGEHPLHHHMPIALLAYEFRDADVLGEQYKMPLIVYYGTDRAVFDKTIRRYAFKAMFARFSSLNGALRSTTRFKQVFDWFYTKENEENRELKKRQALDYTDPGLDCVRRAITTFFSPKFKNPRTELRPLRFMVDWQEGDHYIPLDLNQLSDGYRTTLALVADLARRMVEANPPGCGIDDPLNTEAIVLIDEVDLHLHPEWQQRILTQLQETFPKSQFIVTTHSPQVLSTVPTESIRIVDNGKVYGATPGTEGAESARLLKEIFGVEPRPLKNEFTKKLFEYLALVYDDQWDSAEAIALRAELDTHFQGHEVELFKADLHIENRKWELET